MAVGDRISTVMQPGLDQVINNINSQLSQTATELDNAQLRISHNEDLFRGMAESVLPDVNVTSYGFATESANAQPNGAMSLKIKARTLKNELVYNRDTWAEWDKTLAVGAGTGLEFTGDGTTYPLAYINTAVKPLTKYALLLNIPLNTLSADLKLTSYLTGGVTPLSFVSAGGVGNVKVVFTTQAAITTNRIRFEMGVPATGLKLRMRDVRVFELPTGSEIETDFNTLSADQLAEKYPYVQGQRDTKGGRLRISTKNFFPKDALELNSIAVSGGTNADNSSHIRTKGFIDVLGSVFTMTAPIGYRVRYVYFYDKDKLFLTASSLVSNKTVTLTKPVNSRYIRAIYTNDAITTLSAIDVQKIQDGVQIEYGSAETPYQPYSDPTLIYLPDVGGVVSTAVDEINPVTGEKVNRTKEYVLKASDVQSVTAGTNVDFALINTPADCVTLSVDGSMVSMYDVPKIAFADKDNINSVGNYYIATTLRYIVAKGTTLAQAQALLAGKKLRYQLATPITTYLLPQSAKSSPSGSIIWEPIKGEVGFYGTNLAVTDTTLPIKSIVRLNKVNQADGTSTPLDISKVVISSDKLSFTHPDIASGNLVDWDYEYDSALSTNPKMEIGYSNGYTGNVTIGSVTLQIKGGVITGVTTS